MLLSPQIASERHDEEHQTDTVTRQFMGAVTACIATKRRFWPHHHRLAPNFEALIPIVNAHGSLDKLQLYIRISIILFIDSTYLKEVSLALAVWWTTMQRVEKDRDLWRAAMRQRWPTRNQEVVHPELTYREPINEACNKQPT